MTKFIQIHMLTHYPASNLNRDDLGRPKTMLMGGKNRLRISSQSLKRAWRTSNFFFEELSGSMGVRTKNMGLKLFDLLIQKNIAEKDAKNWIKEVMEQFGPLEKVTKENKKERPNKDLEHSQLVHFSPEEIVKLEDLVKKCAERKSGPEKEELKLLQPQHQGADIALFGRMIASCPEHSVEAAVQVAHAFTVDHVPVQEDYFTAIDDLSLSNEHSGAAHIGEIEFGSGVFYSYICIDVELLTKNLKDNIDLKNRTLKALLSAASMISPKGKQNSFASRARASYILVEKGRQQPRSLAVSFLKPISGEDILKKAIYELEKSKEEFKNSYGCCNEEERLLNCKTGQGTFDELLSFITQ